MLRTADAIAATLGRDGLVRRYHTDDGLGGGEGAFLACTFWLAECLARQGRLDQARTWFAHATATANDLGLLAEQVDPDGGGLLSNFPQGLSHLDSTGRLRLSNPACRSDSTFVPGPLRKIPPGICTFG